MPRVSPSPVRRLARAALATLAPVVLAAHAAAAQTAPAAPGAAPSAAPGAAQAALRVARLPPAVDSCAEAAEAGRRDAAVRLADAAEGTFRARVAADPRDADAHVALATTLLRCRVPFAELAEKGALSGEAIDLLQRALDVEPGHWTARFVLASTYLRLPAFMGRGPDAIRQLDALLALQGERRDVPVLARPWELRGMLWERAGRADSARAVWARGAQLFPDDAGLARRLAQPASAQPAPAPAPASAPAPAAAPTSAAPAPAATARTVGALGPVRVVASAAPAVAATTPGLTVLSRAQVLMTPGAMGDVLQGVGLQPGATRATEGSDVYTRGGDPAETPILIDGGRIPGAARFEGLNGGLFGALDPAVLRNVRFSTGAFSARVGNALSGVLDLETDGRPRARSTRAGLNTVQASGTGRTPLSARTGAWGSLRASNSAALLALHDRRAEFEGSPWSLEGVGGVVAEPRPGTELRAVGMLERDAAARVVDAGGWTAPFRTDGDTRALVLSGRSLLRRAPVRLSANLAVADRTVGLAFGVLARDRRDASVVSRVDGEWSASGALTLRGGVEAGRYARRETGRVPVTPHLAPGSPSRPLADAGITAGHVGGWSEGTLAVGHGVQVEAGLRADRLPGEVAVTLDPRGAVAWRGGAWTARVGGGVFHQGRWRPAPAVASTAVPSGVPRRATHLVAGLERGGAVAWRVEAFRKTYGRYVAPLGGAAGAGAPLGPPVAGGRAQGLDVVLRPTTAGRVGGWLGYSLLDADLRLADGRRVRSPVDVTHSLTGVGTVALGRGLSLGATGRYGTGLPFTPVAGTTPLPGPDGDAGWVLPVWSAPLSARLPAYARLDLRLTETVATRAGLLLAYVEGVNVLNRANTSSYTYDATYRTRHAVHSFFAARTLIVGVEFQPR